ncbi:MAG: MlaD family protein [Deltaproteobacteria bacterium]|nr:MlaD family protein [Deltaproteobacteria bacterium]
MSARANYFKIGLFVLSAATIGVIAIIVFGAGTLFREKFLMETYIKESVQGLDIGSPVKFRGVQIGNVEKITIVGRVYDNDSRLVLVRFSIFPDVFRVPVELGIERGLEKSIKEGLRVRVAAQGITGTAYIEADYLDPERNPPLDVNWEPQYPYIPSGPSTITRLSESVDRIFRNLEQINIQGITVSVEKSLKAVTKAVEDANVERLSEQAERLLVEVRESNRRIGLFLDQTKIGPLLSDASATVVAARRIVEDAEGPLNQVLTDLPQAAASIKNLANQLNSFLQSKEIRQSLAIFKAASEDLPETIALFRRTLRRLDNLISSQQQDIELTIENFRLISANLKELTDSAKQYPSQVLFGEPPPPSEPGNRR